MIKLMNKNTNEIREYKNANQASIILSLDSGNINKLLKGKLKSVKGWILVNDDIVNNTVNTVNNTVNTVNTVNNTVNADLLNQIEELKKEIERLKQENERLQRENSRLLGCEDEEEKDDITQTLLSKLGKREEIEETPKPKEIYIGNKDFSDFE